MMKKLFIAVGLLLTLFLYALPVTAETPDGQTPAQETVCDQLKEESVTKGLYGLCVAFCEAQDFADIEAPITPEELESISIDAPSGRILENYNKKKQESDPEMPCVLVQEECPCFTTQEIQNIDGYDSDGLYMDNFKYYAFDFWGRYFFGYMSESNNGSDNDKVQVDMWTSEHSGSYCSYTNNQSISPMTRVLYSKYNSDFTSADWHSCYKLLQEAVSSQ